jgi:hypothetical protein
MTLPPHRFQHRTPCPGGATGSMNRRACRRSPDLDGVPFAGSSPVAPAFDTGAKTSDGRRSLSDELLELSGLGDGPGRFRTCDLGIKSPRRRTEANRAKLKGAAKRRQRSERLPVDRQLLGLKVFAAPPCGISRDRFYLVGGLPLSLMLLCVLTPAALAAAMVTLIFAAARG